MADDSGRVPPVDSIDLAQVADFTLGGLLIQPSRRRVSAGPREESVEPRVMQALVALAEAEGAVVSRDALIERCWGGRIVGEDAINRCIAKVRALAATAEPPAFTIETVPKVGYLLQAAAFGASATSRAAASLAESGAAPDRSAAPDSLAAGKPPRTWRTAGIAAGVLIVIVAGAVVAWRPVLPLDLPASMSGTAPFHPPSHSIAVLAFANLSNDPGQDYLSDGFAEALIDELSRVNELQVTARTSSFFFKGKAATIDEIARRLNVASVLEGSLRRQGAHLRIDAHLSDARTGFQLWSHSYDRAPDDLLKLQDEIARSVAEALRVKLVDTDAEGLNQGGTTNPQAFDAFLRGEQHVRAIGDENDAALQEFRKAVLIDPDFGLALSRLSFMLLMISQSSAIDDTYHAMMAEARRAADHAVQVAPNLGLTHAQRALVLRNEVSDMSAAWAEATRALELTPGNATVEQNYALIARTIGHSREAVTAATRAVDLDPLRNDLWWTLGRVLACARRYDDAHDAFEHSIALSGHAPGLADTEFAGLLLKQGNMRAAQKMCATMQSDYGLECLAIADHALGQQHDAETAFHDMQADMGDSGAFQIADVYAQWGQPALALHWLKKARAMNASDLWDLKCDQFLDPIRGEPGFREIEDSLHFPPPE